MRKRTYSEEVLKLYEELIKLDPSHKRYYEDERSLVLMSQVCFCGSVCFTCLRKKEKKKRIENINDKQNRYGYK